MSKPPPILDYDSPIKRPSALAVSLRRLVAAFLWFWAGVYFLLAVIAVWLRKDVLRSINSDLLNWRDVTKTASLDIFLTVFFVVCALALRKKRQ